MTSLTYDAAWRGDAPLTGVTPVSDDGRGGQWPRMVNLDDDTLFNLKMWIDTEIEDFNRERQPLLDDWKAWESLYWAAPATEEKNFPFKRAANVVIPLAAIAVEAIHARFMNTLFSVEPFWSIRPRSKEWIAAAKPTEKYLQSEVENGETLRMFEFCNESLLELTKLGTCVAKTGYERRIKKSLRVLGDTEEDFFATVYNGAVVGRVPLGNFIQRFSELDPQTAPMVGEKHEFSWSQLKKMAQSGRMDPKKVEEIKNRWVDINSSSEANDGSQLQDEINKNAKTEPLWSEIFEVYELWVSFDVDGDGWDEEVVLDYHKESGVFLSIRYNWYEDLHRPYRIANYLNVVGIWPGIGVCKQIEQFQEEVTTIHRQRLDNATLANMAQIVLKKGMGYGPGEPIFPGKMWFVDDVRTDIKEFKLSEVYPSSYANEDSLNRYSDMRSGANEVFLGVPSQGTPGTATGDLTRLAEGNKRFDLAMKNIKRWLSLIGVDVITNMQLFGNQQMHWLVLGEDGIWVEQVLSMPSVLIRRGALVELTVSDSITNKEVEQRTWLQLFQVLTNYYDRVLGLAEIITQFSQDPTMFVQIAQRALIASDEATRRLLETFQVTDTDRFTLGEDNPNGNDGSATPPGAGPPGANGNSLQPGVGSVPRVAGGTPS